MINQLLGISEYIALSIITLYFMMFKWETKTRNLKFMLLVLVNLSAYVLSTVLNLEFLKYIFFVMFCFLCFGLSQKSKTASSLFWSIGLTATFITIKTSVFLILSGIFTINKSNFTESSFLNLSSSILSLSVYIVAIYVFSKFTDRKIQRFSYISIALLCMPSTCILSSLLSVCLFLSFDMDNSLIIILTATNILLLISSGITIYVHEKSIRVAYESQNIKAENTELKNKDTYYNEIKKQSENSRILAHDFSRHLNTIGSLSENQENITEYISNISEDFAISNPIDYSSNPTLNIITHRFYDKCKEANIRFDVNIREAQISFMIAPDITALFDNLLENAFESAVLAEQGTIDFSIYMRNKNFVIIELINSCPQKPKYESGELRTKKTTPYHGIGTKSIGRIVKKYDGEASMLFNEEDGTFEVVIMLRTTVTKD